MSQKGYCTVEDVRRLLRERELSGALEEAGNQAVVDAIAAQSEWLQETTNRHWFEPDGVEEDDHGIVYAEPLVHDRDVQDIRTKSAFLLGEEPEPKSSLQLARRDVRELTELLVRNADGGYDDWVDDTDYTEGLGADYHVLVDDADGWSDLILDTDTLEDVTDFNRGVIASYEYGIDDLTATVRRGVAALAVLLILADDEAALGIPDNGQLVPADSKINVVREEAERLLEIHEDPR